MKHSKIIFLAILTILCACNRTTTETLPTIPDSQYAQGFCLIQHPDYTEAIVIDPWQDNHIMQRYYLVRSDSTITPTDGLRLRVPLQHVAITSCTHVGFLSELGELKSLCGACSPNIIYTPIPTEAEGCLNLGDAMQLSVERIILSGAQAVMISTYAQGDGARAQLEKANIPIIYNNEWTEATALARAEWLRFIAAFYCKQDLADSLFSQIVQRYDSIKQLAQQRDTTLLPTRTIMTGNNFRGTWYVPSGNTYTARLYTDAGANYRYANDNSQGSLPLSLETVLLQFRDADVWVGSTSRTFSELADTDPKHTWFRAYQTGEVYNFMHRTSAFGANDFWETGVVRPDLILADLVKTLYPTLLPTYNLYFIEQLQ